MILYRCICAKIVAIYRCIYGDTVLQKEENNVVVATLGGHVHQRRAVVIYHLDARTQT